MMLLHYLHQGRRDLSLGLFGAMRLRSNLYENAPMTESKIDFFFASSTFEFAGKEMF